MRLKTLILTAAVAMAIMAVSATPSGAAFGCRPDPRCDMPTPPPSFPQAPCTLFWEILPTPIDVWPYLPVEKYQGPHSWAHEQTACVIALERLGRDYGFEVEIGWLGEGTPS